MGGKNETLFAMQTLGKRNTYLQRRNTMDSFEYPVFRANLGYEIPANNVQAFLT